MILVNLSKPIQELDIDLKDELLITYNEEKSIFIYYYVKGISSLYYSQNLVNLTRFNIKLIEIGDDTFLRIKIKLPKQCNDKDMFLEERKLEILEAMKQSAPDLTLIPITTPQLMRILGFGLN